MNDTLNILQHSSKNIIEYSPKIAAALIFFIFMIMLGRFFGNILLSFLKKSDLSGTHRNFFRKLVIGIFIIIGTSISLNILDLKAASLGLLTGGGITALAIGIAFKDIGENILAGIYLAFSKPFNTGDLIAVKDSEGVVQNVELRHTHIRTYDGSDVFIPNAQILNQPLVNYTKDGLRRISFTIGIDYGDDAAKACILLKKGIQEIDKVLLDPPCIASIQGFSSQYVELKIYYWINTFDKKANFWEVKNKVMDCCRIILKENNYTFSSDVKTANVLTLPEPVQVKSI